MSDVNRYGKPHPAPRRYIILYPRCRRLRDWSGRCLTGLIVSFAVCQFLIEAFEPNEWGALLLAPFLPIYLAALGELLSLSRFMSFSEFLAGAVPLEWFCVWWLGVLMLQEELRPKVWWVFAGHTLLMLAFLVLFNLELI